MAEFPVLLLNTILLRPYVFLFLAAFLFSASRLMGWRRTGAFFLITWITAFAAEFSSTRTGLPFGWYHYTGSTAGRELYISNVPFMDSLSFTFLLYASYCLSLAFLLPASAPRRSTPALLHLMWERGARTSWSVLGLTTLFFVLVDVVIDPVALRGDRWFLGKIYYYPNPGIHFGVPTANYAGWAIVALTALSLYFPFDRRLAEETDPAPVATRQILMGCGIYYGVLLFNLAVTFWIGEPLLGMTGLLIYLPVTALLLLRLFGRLA
jgi:putative membrane protein